MYTPQTNVYIKETIMFICQCTTYITGQLRLSI